MLKGGGLGYFFPKAVVLRLTGMFGPFAGGLPVPFPGGCAP